MACGFSFKGGGVSGKPVTGCGWGGRHLWARNIPYSLNHDSNATSTQPAWLEVSGRLSFM